MTRNGTPTASASTAQTPAGPANPLKAATAISQTPRPKAYQFSQAAVPATRTTPATSSGEDAVNTLITPWPAPTWRSAGCMTYTPSNPTASDSQ